MLRPIRGRHCDCCAHAHARSKMSTSAMLSRHRNRRRPVQPASDALPVVQPPDNQQRYGEVFDRGYKHYDGPRLGRRQAQRALVGYSIKRAMGIKKSWTAKVIPILLYIAVFTPVIISIGIRAFVPTAEVLDYADFFGFVFLIEGVFAATIAPELLCSDRAE